MDVNSSIRVMTAMESTSATTAAAEVREEVLLAGQPRESPMMQRTRTTEERFSWSGGVGLR